VLVTALMVQFSFSLHCWACSLVVCSKQMTAKQIVVFFMAIVRIMQADPGVFKTLLNYYNLQEYTLPQTVNFHLVDTFRK
jgi:hypothetical protein